MYRKAVNMQKKYGGLAAWFLSYASGHTDRQMHKQTNYNTLQLYTYTQYTTILQP